MNVKGQTSISNELSAIMARIVMSTGKRENVAIATEFGKLIDRVEQIETGAAGLSSPEKAISAEIKFTKEERRGMLPAFRREFEAAGSVARVIKRQSGQKRVNKRYVYEIRYRRNGYKIEVSSTDINEAKRKFIQATHGDEVRARVLVPDVSLNLFDEIATEWLTFKRGKVHERTHQSYASYYRRYIFPAVGDKPIKSIRTIDIDNVLKEKAPRLYEELRTIFNAIFKYAIASGIVSYNPVMMIPFRHAERRTEKRRALTTEEQRFFLSRLELPEFKEYRNAFLILFYFGLRPCELEGARFEDGFLIARNAKRKGGKIEYKKIPVSKQAGDKLDTTAPIGASVHRTDVLNRIFKRIMGGENGTNVTQYSLRHTFATVCQQYVRPDIVDIWMGDSSERLVGRVYTHFSDEFMQEQMKKVNFEV